MPSSNPLSNDSINPVIHAPARLKVMAVLMAVESADFLFIQRQTGLTKGNLSSHMSKLEMAGYIRVQKEFVGKIPRTLLRITEEGRHALIAYRQRMQKILDDLE
jgi:DNA-binding transcriptional ArsR family regulator